MVTVGPGDTDGHPAAEFGFYDEKGIKLYSVTKTATKTAN